MSNEKVDFIIGRRRYRPAFFMSTKRDKYRRRKIAAQIARAKLQRQVLTRHLRGDTYEEIGRALEISWQSAYRAYRAALAAIPALEAEAARRESLARLDAIRAEAWRHMDDDPAAMLAILIKCEEPRPACLGWTRRHRRSKSTCWPLTAARFRLRWRVRCYAIFRIAGSRSVSTTSRRLTSIQKTDSNTDEQLLPVVVSVEEARAAFKALESEDGADERLR